MEVAASARLSSWRRDGCAESVAHRLPSVRRVKRKLWQLSHTAPVSIAMTLDQESCSESISRLSQDALRTSSNPGISGSVFTEVPADSYSRRGMKYTSRMTAWSRHNSSKPEIQRSEIASIFGICRCMRSGTSNGQPLLNIERGGLSRRRHGQALGRWPGSRPGTGPLHRECLASKHRNAAPEKPIQSGAVLRQCARTDATLRCQVWSRAGRYSPSK